MPAIVPRFGIGTIDYSITSGSTNVNASTLFGEESYQSKVWKRVIIYPGVIIGTTDISGYALTIPSGLGGRLYLINRGSIYGAGGTGGTSASLNGTNGGNAINAGAANIFIDNRDGIINAGGGGGGASPASTSFNYNFTIPAQSGSYSATFSGSSSFANGGNGQGYNQPQTNGSLAGYNTSTLSASGAVVNPTSVSIVVAQYDTFTTSLGTIFVTASTFTTVSLSSVSGSGNSVSIGDNSTVSMSASGTSQSFYFGSGVTGTVTNNGIGNAFYFAGSNTGGITFRDFGLSTTISYNNGGRPTNYSQTCVTTDYNGASYCASSTVSFSGNGGTWGSSGQNGGPGGGTGGAGGKYIVGNSNVTWLNTGTRLGGFS